MMMFDSVVVLGVVGLIIYVTISTLMRRVEQPRLIATSGGRWQAAHYAADHATRIVVRKVLPDGATVVDEHLIASLAEDDPDYDAKFLAAMAQARERVSLYESEEP
jgi:hypothetical protein